MYDLNALYFFVQIVEYEGYSAASRALGVPKSKLSRTITELEERLGVKLIIRSTRHFGITEIGQEYFQHCIAMLAAAESAQAVIEQNQAEPKGIVRLSCPTALLNFVIAGIIARYMAQYPKVEIQIESTNREVDVIREGIDIALRIGVPPFEDSGLVMKVLSQSPQELVVSPKLLEQFGAPTTLEELSKFSSLYGGSVQKKYEWSLESSDHKLRTVQHYPRLVTDDLITVRRVALEQGGIAQLPLLVVFKDIMQGRLVQVLPDWKPQSSIVHATFISRRGLLPSVRTLLDFLGSNLGDMDFSNLYPDYVLRGDEDACFLTESKL